MPDQSQDKLGTVAVLNVGRMDDGELRAARVVTNDVQHTLPADHKTFGHEHPVVCQKSIDENQGESRPSSAVPEDTRRFGACSPARPLLIKQAHNGEQHLAQLARLMLFGPGVAGVTESFGHQIGGGGILAVHSQNVTFGDAS